MKTESDNEGPMILPEWKAALEVMREQGVTHGSTFKVEFFKEHMRLDPEKDQMRFALGISQIRRELEKDGMYLSGEGGKGQLWVVRPPNENAGMMVRYGRKALDALKRGVILGTNTPLDTLTQEERRKHEQICERMAKRLVLMRRSESIPNNLPQLLS